MLQLRYSGRAFLRTWHFELRPENEVPDIVGVRTFQAEGIARVKVLMQKKT